MKPKLLVSIASASIFLLGAPAPTSAQQVAPDEAQEVNSGIKKINPSTLYDGSAFGLSQATVDMDSGLIFVSGQVDWDLEYKVKNPGIEEQTTNSLENLKTILEEANSSLEHILQLRVFVRGELADSMDKVVPVLASYFGETRPALTGIGVASLATPDTLIEIEAVAKVISD